jgi:type III pantothenate kinase
VSERIVVDVGNTRVKFGRCMATAVVESVSLRHDPSDWEHQISSWAATAQVEFVIAGVAPKTIELLRSAVTSSGHRCRVLTSNTDVPIKIDVDQPENVGIDRLLGGAAARALFPGQSLCVVDAGSAITVNLVDAAGVFRGGAILPGIGFMSAALHERTAQLPLVEAKTPAEFPGRDTEAAMRIGVQAAAIGAIERLTGQAKVDLLVFTGGDGEWLEPRISFTKKHFNPRLILEGIRIAAERPS